MEVMVLRGEAPKIGDGYGYGDGYGDGYGYGSGSGSGDGYGYGYGSGSGSGDGYGYGYGADDGSGSGSGDGYGYGYGADDGYDLVASSPSPELITADRITKAGACAEEVKKFARLFPDGGRWPEDCAKAEAAGLDVSWVTKNLGLLPLIKGE